MSDHFLNKLKSIRVRYGIEKTQQNNHIKIEHNKPKQNISRKRPIIANKQITKLHEPTFFNHSNDRFKYSDQLFKRSSSLVKKPVSSEIQNIFDQKQIPYLLHKKSYDRIFRQKDYNDVSKPLGPIDSQCQSQQLSRSYSLPKQKSLNKYDLIYNYDENLTNLPGKNQYPSQTLQRQPLRISNRALTGAYLNSDCQNSMKINYTKIQTRRPSLSYTSQRGQATQDWTLDNLCKVQQKIQAYLRR